MSSGSNNKIVKYLRTVKTRRTSLRLRNKINLDRLCTPSPCFHPLGLFGNIPEEVLFYIFKHIPLFDLSSLTLTSKAFRDKILRYHYSVQALPKLKPAILVSAASNIDDEQTRKETLYYSHFHHLGIFLKRLTCLYSTRERLRIVGVLLEKLRDTHLAICENYGSDSAYRCYGYMLHAFIAGWENDEKCRAYAAIKGASRVDERLNQALNKGPGSLPWYEKYVRVFYREIFLDKAEDDAELGFWLSQMLSPLPLVFQARMLYILYGPQDSDQELLVWDRMTTCPTFYGVADKDLEGIAKALTNLYVHRAKAWSRDNLVSVLEELIALPAGWCLENIAKLLKMCGERICCEFLSSKAINGRIEELAYIGYYIVQTILEDKPCGSESNTSNLEWFVNVMKQILRVTSCEKQRNKLVSSLFDVWEETLIGLHEDIYSALSNDTEYQDIYTTSVHHLAKLAGLLMLENFK